MGILVKSIKQIKVEKIDCFAYRPMECVALTKKNCDKCRFYKTEDKLKLSKEKAMNRIATLDEETQERIALDYFGDYNYEPL